MSDSAVTRASVRSNADPFSGQSARVQPWQLGLLLAVLTIVIYLPALRGGFIWNDNDYVTSPALRSWSGLWRIWFEVGATEQYYPLLHSAFWFEQKLWGDAALGYHAINVVFHLANALLLVRVLRQLEIRGAWLAGFLFALHPVGVESVAWIAEQKNTLSTLFFLAAASVYLRFDERRRPADYWLASGLYLAALLSKSLTATLCGALLVVSWWRRGRIEWRRDVLPLIPWMVFGAAAGLFTGWVERTFLAAQGADFDLSLAQRAIVAGRVVWFYLGKLLWPENLIFIYPRWEIRPGLWWQWSYLIALLAALVALWQWRHRSRAPLAALLFFIGTLFPVSGIFNVYGFLFSYVADHWQYLPSLGIFALAAAGLAWIGDRISRNGAVIRVGASTLLVGLLGMLSFRQSGLYRDIVTFYHQTLAANPACWMAHNNLGTVLMDSRQWDQAIAHFESGLRLKPSRFELHNNLATALARLGRWQEAADHFGEAIRLNAKSFVSYDGLGSVLHKVGRNAEAVGFHERAIALKPDYAEAHNNLGSDLLDLRENERAIAAISTALRLKPDLAEAHNNLGIALARAGRIQDAITHYAEALRLNPDFGAAHDNLGVAFAGSGLLQEAIAEYEQAQRLNGVSAITLNNMGNALRGLRKLDEAVGCFQRAIELRPDIPDLHFNLALALNDLGRNTEAKHHYDIARQLNPNLRANVPGLDDGR